MKFTTFLHHNLHPLIDVSQLQQRAWSVGDDNRFDVIRGARRAFGAGWRYAMSRRERHDADTERTVAAMARYGELDEVFPANKPCGLCGDEIVGQRHRVMDAIAEQIRCGIPWQAVVVDWLDAPDDDARWTKAQIVAAANMAIYALAVSR